MNRNNLAAAMNQEAAESCLEFSPLLHARIMQRIRIESSVPLKPSRFTIHRNLFAGAAAAIFALAPSILMLKSPNPTGPKTIAQLPSIPSIRNPVAELEGPVSDSLVDARFAYLDRDAGNALRYIANQADVLPISR